MTERELADYYEVLQVSTSSEPETINRVYRMLAQRYHPDNQQTGDERRFREILEAYTVLSDPERRARYDVVHQQRGRDPCGLRSCGGPSSRWPKGWHTSRCEQSSARPEPRG